MKRIPSRGKSRQEIFSTLESFRSGDIDWKGGKSFGHAFLAGPEATQIVEQAYLMYLWENALDPTLFPSLLEMEREVVAMAASHLNAGPDAAGNFTSGGTESILLGVKTARDKMLAENPKITRPRMILPVTAHAAFRKAAEYFCIEPVPIDDLDDDYRVNVDAMADAIDENTVLLVGSAVQYAHGVVDPIVDIGKLALDRGIPFHVDGCIGAFLLPYFRQLGNEIDDFDFSVEGVSSISMDFHKYSFAAKGASVVVYNTKHYRKHQIFSCTDWTGYTLINPTVLSSRSGGPLAATWAVLNFIGEQGYLEICRDLKRATDRVIDAIESIDGLCLMGKPQMSLLAATSNELDIFELVDEMKLRGWHLQAQMGLGRYKENFHLTILPNNVERIETFIADLKECVGIVRAKPAPDAGPLEAMINGVDWSSVSDEELQRMLGAVGIGGDSPPKRMAEINRILNKLPPQVTDRIMKIYYNEIATPAD